MRLPFAKPKSVSDYVDPPKGTHAISTSQLPNQPDWARAMLCAELSFFAYRVANRYRNTSSELEQDRARIQTAARILGYEADVISTPTQQAVIFYNNLEAVVAFEGSRADNLGHYNRNLITHLRGLKTFAPRHFAGKFHYGFSTALDEPVISDEYGDSAYIGPPSLYFHDEHVKSLYMKNVAYNLSAYGKRVGNTMYFPLQEMAFLSTNNVAASAIATVDDAYKKYHEAYQAIINTITMQIRPDGLFDSVIKTSPTTNKASLQQDRDFAPASAMIAMGEAIENHTLEIDPDAFKPTFDFYFDYWDRSKNLYGAAWQPIGYYHMGAAVQDDDYFKAAMTVADQLVNCQNILLQIPENIGAFSKIECLSASDRSISSGVRIEAIVAAYRAAKAMGDTQRMERYRASVKLAMRHILQGQLRKDNIFYVPNIEKSLYGIRDSYANNSIRIDNVAHTVNGVYAALTYMDGLFDE